MPAKVEKTNAMRVLEGRGVAYEAHYYPAERHSATEVAALIGRPPEQVFKTLVAMPLEPKARPVLAIVPGDRELDLKLMAKAAGQKKMRMATQREAESLTGLLVGGISALALLNKGFKVYLDSSAEAFERIIISAGQRGINLEEPTPALIEITGAAVCPLAGP